MHSQQPRVQLKCCAALQNKIGLGKADQALKLDLKIGGAVTVDIARDDSLVVRGPSQILFEKPYLARHVVERNRADETEILIAGDGTIRVDGSDVDIVDQMLEVRNDIAGIRRLAAF